MKHYQTILDFWFSQPTKLWWQKNPDFDAHIKHHFEPLILQAEKGEFDDWLENPDSCLALILLCDQFPRNCYRNDAKAYGLDAKALHDAFYALEKNYHLQLPPMECTFLFMPLEHSENLTVQQRCVALFEVLVDRVSDDKKPQFLAFLDYAQRHLSVIEKFGRFPHRNKILGRSSTKQELAFLEQPNSTF